MGSCSQNCENCAPGVGLYSIGASAQIYPSLFGCLNGDSLPEGTLGYSNYTYRVNGRENSNANLNCFYNIGGGTTALAVSNSSYNNGGSSSYSYSKKPYVDQYGRYIEKVQGNSSFSANEQSNYYAFAWYGAPAGSPSEASSNGTSNIECTLVECDFNQCKMPPCGYFVCETNCQYSASANNMPPCIDGQCTSYNISDNRCVGFAGCDPGEGSCTSVNCSSQSSYVWQNPDPGPTCYSANSSSNTNGTTTVSSPVTMSTAKGFSRSSVNTRMSIYASNSDQDPCGTNCGLGKDACWGGGFSFTPVDNTNNSYYSRIKVKVAASKESMKPYSSVRGTVYFYENSTPGCCGEGNPVFTSNFSLGSSANFKDGTMVAQDVYNFENDSMQDYVGSTIVACVKINGVDI